MRFTLIAIAPFVLRSILYGGMVIISFGTWRIISLLTRLDKHRHGSSLTQPQP